MTEERVDLGSAKVVQHSLDSLHEIFHENTKLNATNETRLGIEISQLAANQDIVAMISKGYNRFPHLPRVPLPKQIPPTTCTLDEAIWRRRSVREFTGKSILLEQLSQLLFLTYGETGGFSFGEGSVQALRAAPSGGGLYPTEVYVIARHVEGLEAGVYHYVPPDHAVEHLPPAPDLAADIESVSHYQETLTSASVLFVLTSVFDRSTFKYGSRGYRFALLDAGHTAQNLLLASSALDLGAVPIGGFRDDQLSRMVGADGVNEGAVYLVAVGRPTEAARKTATQQRTFVRPDEPGESGRAEPAPPKQKGHKLSRYFDGR